MALAFVSTEVHITDRHSMFFRPDLESTLQPLNSSSRKRLSRRPREVSGHVEDQAKSPTGLGHEATPHGWRSAQSTSARRRRAGLCSRFPGFQSAGWAYPFVSCMFCFAPRTTQNLLGYPMIPPAPIPCVFIPLPVSFDITDQFAPTR